MKKHKIMERPNLATDFEGVVDRGNPEVPSTPKVDGRLGKVMPEVIFSAPDLGPAPTWRETFDHLVSEQDRVRRIERSQEHARVEISSRHPVGVMFTSDWHIGSSGTDYEAWKHTMETVKNNPSMYMVLLSNTIDNFVFPSGMFEQMIHPSEQMQFIQEFAKEYGPKILAIVGSRCHEGWTSQKTDVDIQRQVMFKDNIEKGTPWLGKSGTLDIVVNGIEYSTALAHKSRFQSSLNPTNANRQMHDLRYPTDIVAIAHNHVKMTTHGIKYEGKYAKEVVYLRTGAYKIEDEYGQLEGFGKGQLGSPTVVLDPREKQMQEFFNTDQADKYLLALREIDEMRRAKNRPDSDER